MGSAYLTLSQHGTLQGLQKSKRFKFRGSGLISELQNLHVEYYISDMEKTINLSICSSMDA